MCPSCGRRMAPASASPAAAPPPPPSAPPPSPYAPPPPSPSAPPPPPPGTPATAHVAGEPAYAPYATAESAWPGQGGPPGADVDFRRDAIASTSRATVAFRLVLALPHLIVLWALAYGVAAVTV